MEWEKVSEATRGIKYAGVSLIIEPASGVWKIYKDRFVCDAIGKADSKEEALTALIDYLKANP